MHDELKLVSFASCSLRLQKDVRFWLEGLVAYCGAPYIADLDAQGVQRAKEHT